jgi:hypothetical protein
MRTRLLALLAVMIASTAVGADTPTEPKPPEVPTNYDQCRAFQTDYLDYLKGLQLKSAACGTSLRKILNVADPAWQDVRVACAPIPVPAGCAQVDSDFYCAQAKYYELMPACRAQVKAFLDGKPGSNDTMNFSAIGSATGGSAYIDRRDQVPGVPASGETADPDLPHNPVPLEYKYLHDAFEGTYVSPPADIKGMKALTDALETAHPESIADREAAFAAAAAAAVAAERPTEDEALAFLRKMAADAKSIPPSKGVPNALSEVSTHSGGSGSGGGGGGGGGSAHQSSCGNPYGGSSAPPGTYICSNQGELLACQCGGGHCSLIHTGAIQCSRPGAVIR